jgi:hypothetical protein
MGNAGDVCAVYRIALYTQASEIFSVRLALYTQMHNLPMRKCRTLQRLGCKRSR